MIRRGNIQNDKENNPGYVARIVPEKEIRLAVAIRGDRILLSDDLGETYRSLPTRNGPIATNVINSNPVSVQITSGGKVASLFIARANYIDSFEGTTKACLTYSTKIVGEDGTARWISTDSTSAFRGQSMFVSDTGTRQIIFAKVKFSTLDDSVNAMIYSTDKGKTWKYHTKWTGTSWYGTSASDNLKVIASNTQYSNDYGMTVNPLDGHGFQIMRVAVSGNGKKIYAIREKLKGRSTQYTSEAYVSVTTNHGKTWKNLFDLKVYGQEKLSSDIGFDITTNVLGDCVAFTYKNKYFGWSPNGGETFVTEELDHTYVGNFLSMDPSGYYIAITNSSSVISILPLSYVSGSEKTKLYIKDMRNGIETEPIINNAITKVACKAKLR